MAALLRPEAPPRDARILVTSPEALVQRLPPAEAVQQAVYTLKTGDVLDRDGLTSFAKRVGYTADDRTDEPSELLILGEVVDVYPPNRMEPVRVKMDAGDRIVNLENYNPLTQRSTGSVQELLLGAASEFTLADGEAVERDTGAEHHLALGYGSLRTV